MPTKYQKEARKRALEYIGLDHSSDISYAWLAREVAAKDPKVIIDGLDLSIKAHAAAFLAAWRPRGN